MIAPVAASTSRIVVTDLDGSLLDHYTYDYTAAETALNALEHAGVPVILASSKTRAEMQALREAMGNWHPYIVENGAGIAVPSGYFGPAVTPTEAEDDRSPLAQPRAHWLQCLDAVKTDFAGEFESFAAGGDQWVSEVTGLSLEAARRANQREFTEPVAWLGSEDRQSEFIRMLESMGARVQRGGRFLAVGGDADKGRALRNLRDRYADYAGAAVKVLALGDSHNDVAMLAAADAAVLVRSPVHEFPRLDSDFAVYRSEAIGPEGWAEGVFHWLEGEQV